MVVGFIFLIGIAIGSFLNVLIDRLPEGETVLYGRSHCDYCKKTLRWFELIPLLSFLLQSGKCRRCHKRLSWQYPLVETANGILYGGISWWGLIQGASPLHIALLCICASVFLVIFMTDVKEQIIPDSMIIALCLMGALLIWRHPDTRISSAGAGVGAGLFFFLLWALTRGKGMGFGDVKLAAALGLLLGYPRILIACYIAFLTGAIVGVILMGARRAGMKTRLAFGPFLLLGSIGSVLFGDIIWQTVRLYF